MVIVLNFIMDGLDGSGGWRKAYAWVVVVDE